MSAIVEKAQPIINYLIQFNEKVERNDTDELYYQKTYNDLIDKLKQFKSELDELTEDIFKVDVLGIPKVNITKDIQYAMAMLCDEIIMNSNVFEEWDQQLLDEYIDFAFLNPGRRAQEFYEVYERIGKKNKAIEDFFYVCLALGFQGKKEGAELRKFKENLISPHIQPIDKSSKLTPSAEDCIKSSKTFYTRLSSRVYQTICAVLIFVVICICLWLRHDVTFPIEVIVQEIQNQQ
jgi:type VI protein secretion system component VasF